MEENKMQAPDYKPCCGKMIFTCYGVFIDGREYQDFVCDNCMYTKRFRIVKTKEVCHDE
ncbi:hypothetical protein KAR91_10310 [Candidatus Pacearchaeota archaeon]|nr:hypothetical protein [Candidatus Pacearchaeota archaeon]